MINSIRYFNETSTTIFENLEKDFLKDPTKIAEYVLGVSEELRKVGLNIVKESLEMMNQFLKESNKRKNDWVVEKNTRKQLITSLGTIDYTKTLFTHKESGEMCYLLDRIMELSSHERITADAEAKMLEEAVQTSYRRGGEAVSSVDNVSKQTVKNKLHVLRFPEENHTGEKKVLDYLFLDADEDHVSLQFRNKKGDLAVSENGYKNNGMITKLVYVYEGIEKESPKSARHRLINPHYFCTGSSEKTNEEFWDEVYHYLDVHYDLSKMKKIYLNADGGAWIKAGKRRIAGITYVLDEFHLQKYIMKMVRHTMDSMEDAKKEIYDSIKKKDKDDFRQVVEKLHNCATTEQQHKRIDEGRDYILSNWTAAKIRLSKRDTIKGCSAEGHVSHVLSSRMSSRPMGWSIVGGSKMAELRAYYYNGGDMLELVRYQKEEIPMAAGMEKDYISAAQINSYRNGERSELAKYSESISHTITLDTKKKAWFNGHIWGL